MKMRVFVGLLGLVVVGVVGVCLAAGENALSAEEKEAGWRLLFDGRSTAGWRGYKGTVVPGSWKVENGSLLARRQEGVSAGTPSAQTVRS